MASEVVPSPIGFGTYSANDINFGKYFKAVNQAGKTIFKHCVILLFSRIEGTNQGGMSILEHCKSKLKWSNAMFKQKQFSKMDIQKLKLSPLRSEFEGDVTLYFKIICEVLQPLPDTLISNLRQLKCLRNIVCHEEESISESRLQVLLHDLKLICASTLEELGLVTETDTSKIISDLMEQLELLIHSHVLCMDSVDIDSYKHFKENDLGVLIREGRKELMTTYANFKVLNPCGWLDDNHFTSYTVDNVFTVLRFSHTGMRVDMADVLQVSSKVKTRFKVRSLIFSGLMGSGKTSLCRFFLQEWCSYGNTVKGLRDYDLLLFISIRQVRSTNLKQYILEQLLHSSTRHIKPDEIVSFLQNLNTLFLIDGYDEASSNAKVLVKEILSKFTNSLVLITTRPEFLVELMDFAHNHIVINVLGFDDNCIRDYASKVTDLLGHTEIDGKKMCEEFLSFIHDVAACLGDHLRLPLTIALLFILWKENNTSNSKITNATTLYLELFNMCKMKLIWRLQSKNLVHQLHFEHHVHRWYDQLCKLACEMLLADKLTLEKDHVFKLTAAAEECGIDTVETLSAFLNCESHASLAGPSFSFSFLHNSAQEFLAAEYFVHLIHLRDDTDSEVNDYRVMKLVEMGNAARLGEMFNYTVGLLTKNHELKDSQAELIVKCLIQCVKVSEQKIMPWVQLLSESGNDPALCLAVGEVLSSKARWAINSSTKQFLSHYHLELLRKTSSAPRFLVVDFDFNTSPYDIPYLKDLLSIIAIGKRSLVHLNFNKEYNDLDEEEVPEMDELVVPLLHSNSVVELTGHGGTNVVRALKKASRLKSLRLRISTFDCLCLLSDSVRCPRLLSNFVLFHKNTSEKNAPKSQIEYLEIFLDVSLERLRSRCFQPLDFNGTLILKLSSIKDSDLELCAKVISALNKSYCSVIFLQSDITFMCLKQFLKKTSSKIKEILIYSSQNRAVSKNETVVISSCTVRWFATRDYGRVENGFEFREESDQSFIAKSKFSRRSRITEKSRTAMLVDTGDEPNYYYI